MVREEAGAVGWIQITRDLVSFTELTAVYSREKYSPVCELSSILNLLPVIISLSE